MTAATPSIFSRTKRTRRKYRQEKFLDLWKDTYPCLAEDDDANEIWLGRSEIDVSGCGHHQILSVFAAFFGFIRQAITSPTRAQVIRLFVDERRILSMGFALNTSPNTAKNNPKTATNRTFREYFAKILSDVIDSIQAAIIGAAKIQNNSKINCPMNLLGVRPP